MQKKKLFDKVLIANRGEIAVRIIKTLKKLGIKSVAVYSEADTNSLHVSMADEAIFIGNSPATDSYLSIPHIISAIRQTGAQAVHPGYGFLSENYAFASALRDENVTLLGPSPEAIKSMGDKIEAKKLAEKAGVNTVPGYLGVIKDAKNATKIAQKLGFPVMVKAAAGGGGKGMRVVRNAEDMVDSFSSASNEARNNFNDARVFLEKFIENPRHIEIQVLADKFGNVVCIGERECSIQRHHQKVIEEAPSPFISDKTRKEMYKQSIKLVKKIGYYSVGTVEFIVDKKQNFYFMEMNTRLQVEHCVTELVYNLDLVEQMIIVAAGEKITIKQSDLKPNGWAIESRICSEDPARKFLPSSGRITQYQEPPKNSKIRVDSGIAEGGEVSMFYDQMISKLCTHAPTRLEAIELMRKALSEYIILGISHNISFLEAIMQNTRFVDGNFSTNFIAEEYPDGFLGAEINSEITLAFIGVAIHIHMTEAIRASSIIDDRASTVGTRWVVNIDSESYPVIIKPVTNGYNIRYERNRIYVRSNWIIGATLFRGQVNNKNVNVRIESILNNYKLTYAGREVIASIRSPRVAELEQFMPTTNKNKAQPILTAPLSGMIVKIFVKPGEEVKAGQKLLIIEAMKMENVICAEHTSKITSINVAEKEQVAVGAVIIEFEV
ncbi:MAG: acetyl/propionyl/methylcrotonyl-CoA carboxylase subunit alpha [Alphaproteobacteria bacterium]